MGLMLRKWLGGQSISMMVVGGASLFVAAILMMLVKDTGREARGEATVLRA
jgi:hypothetical protein